ncbi:AAA family ATPase [Candidatus Entotheonella palauensis]|uniref:AAA family ATPase n=1 Tax=Candidatus Entotheonella palauensis TaxID=93172 RepID=UPI000B7CD201|nr:AAA family ATPase [Candidatus Entotheonella palauensis]
MQPAPQWYFESFRLDLDGGCLWRDTEMIPLRPKTFAVLVYLVDHAGQLVSKQDLLDAVWPQISVGDSVLKACLHEIRQALGDTAKSQQFIRTVHRRGYRFIAPVSTANVGEVAQAPPSPAGHGTGILVDREMVLDQLHACWKRSRQGERQIVFITGEAGIGKTAVIEALMMAPPAAAALVLGQCVEQHGLGEAYGPVLEMLGKLCRDADGERITSVLRQHAPTWLVQMPWLLDDSDREMLQRELLGATRERMLRELPEALEVISHDTPLIMILEDLHWSDYATLDLIAVLARRRASMRLLLIATYRPVEVILQNHPLREVKQDLVLRQQGIEVALELLDEKAVKAYLAARFPGSYLPEALTRLIYRRTDGNPLFLVHLTESLITQGFLVNRGGTWGLEGSLEAVEMALPETLRQMIEQQLRRLEPEALRVLETASVVGVAFTAASVAAAMAWDVETVEEWCEQLVHQQHILQPEAVRTWPDGTVSARYEFCHGLFQYVAYQRIGVARRMRLHQRIGERVEAAYGARVAEIAAELAMHYRRGQEPSRAVRYLRLAAENASRRYANREAVDFLSHALQLVDQLAEAEYATPYTAILEQRGMVYRMMGQMQAAAEDFTALAAYAHRHAHTEAAIDALFYRAGVLSWLDRDQCLATVAEAVALSETLQDETVRIYSRSWAGYWHLLWRGWQDADAQACADAVATARQAGDRALLGPHIGRYAYFRSLQSAYPEACEAAEEGIHLAREAGDASEFLLCHFFLAWSLLHWGQWGEMQRVLRDGLTMAEHNGHHRWAMLLRLEEAWLYEQLGDWHKSYALAQQVLAEANEAQLGYGQLAGTVLLGRAALGLGQYQQALQYFDTIIRKLDAERVLMDWIWLMPLHQSLSDYWLQLGEYERARREAQWGCEMASQPGEITYLAQAWGTRAEAAMARQQWSEAERALSEALALVASTEVPLAAWRVYAAAARLAQQRGDQAQADAYCAQSAAVIGQLADSLGDAERLRLSFLAQPRIQAIAGHARL